MKKLVAIGNVVFVYFIAMLLVMIFDANDNKFLGIIWEYCFGNSIVTPLVILFILGIVLFLLNIVNCIKILRSKDDAGDIVKLHFIVKIIQVPAYVLIFIVGLMCMITIFTIGITIVLMLLDMFSVVLTGIYGLAAFQKMKKEETIDQTTQVIWSVGSFVLCVDVAIAVMAFLKEKRVAK